MAESPRHTHERPSPDQLAYALDYADKYSPPGPTAHLAAEVRALRAELAARPRQCSCPDAEETYAQLERDYERVYAERDEARAALAARTPQPADETCRALLAEVALAAGYKGQPARGLVEHVAALHGAALAPQPAEPCARCRHRIAPGCPDCALACPECGRPAITDEPGRYFPDPHAACTSEEVCGWVGTRSELAQPAVLDGEDDGPECDHPPRAGGACPSCAADHYRREADRLRGEVLRLRAADREDVPALREDCASPEHEWVRCGSCPTSGPCPCAGGPCCQRERAAVPGEDVPARLDAIADALDGVQWPELAELQRTVARRLRPSSFADERAAVAAALARPVVRGG